MKLKKSKSDNILTVEVTLPKLDRDEKSYKIDSMTVLRKIENDYDILTLKDRCTLKASHDEDVKGVCSFLLKEEKKTRKKSRSGSKKSKSKSSSSDK